MKKKLYKNKKQGKIEGVCQGISEYLDIDVTLVRVIALILLFVTAFFPVVILYFAIAIIMPDKEDIGFEDYDVK